MIAVIGDVHLLWNDFDVEYFNRSSYELILFVGDIAAYRHREALSIARSISRLRIPSILMPGNHDAAHIGQLIAEVMNQPGMSDTMAGGQPRRVAQLDTALGSVKLAGYSRHQVRLDGSLVNIIAGRPHSMGGPRVAFRRFVAERFGVDSIESSVRRLVALIDDCGDEPLVFLAHNGPSGFGDSRQDIWGCDFRPEQGDFGDPDLAEAVAYARRAGKNVRAVIAGHMHHDLKGGGQRAWSVQRDGVLFLNAARVPRIFAHEDRVLHHHVEVDLGGHTASATAKLIPAVRD